jgi:hypothetical protein
VHASNIENNGAYAMVAISQDDSNSVIDATDNYWGVTDSSQIESLIYHLTDSTHIPLVEFVPFATEPFDIDDTSSTGPDLEPAVFTLGQNYPNPFNPATTIEFTLPSRRHVELSVYNILGRKIRRLLDESMSAGEHCVEWDGLDSNGYQAPTGVYFYSLHAGDITQTKKMLLLK